MSNRLSPSQIESLFAQQQDSVVSLLTELIAIPSVSTDQGYATACRTAAQRLHDHLTSFMQQVELIETSGKPLVFAEYRVPGATRTVLIYGHYDVQPAALDDGWKGDPFAPRVVDGVVYGRGAVDNKGQLVYVLKALETLIKESALGVNVKVLIEGEEESGSIGLGNALPVIGKKLAADVLLCADAGAVEPTKMAFSATLRGSCSLELELRGPAVDVHAGVFGGVLPNPALAAAQIVASLYKPDGSIAVAGFYDDVLEPTAEEQAAADSELIREELQRCCAELQCAPGFGETKYSLAVRRGLRPTIQVQGLTSGYSGVGNKNIIPAKASVKLGVRTVANQETAQVVSLLEQHVRKHCPPGIALTFHGREGGEWVKTPLDSPVLTVARQVARDIYGEEPAIFFEGASIPIIRDLQEQGAGQPLLMGLCITSNGMHSVEENFSVGQLRAGFVFTASLLQRLA